MKIPKLILKTVIKKQLGEDCYDLIVLLNKKSELSEFVIANELKEDVNIVRNKVYRLQKFNLVKSVKKKDKEKGWYVYFWTLIPEGFFYLYEKIEKEEIEDLEKAIQNKQESQYFICKNKCVVLSYEDGLLSNYVCPECGTPLKIYDTDKEILKLKKKLEKLKQSMDKFELPLR